MISSVAASNEHWSIFRLVTAGAVWGCQAKVDKTAITIVKQIMTCTPAVITGQVIHTDVPWGNLFCALFLLLAMDKIGRRRSCTTDYWEETTRIHIQSSACKI